MTRQEELREVEDAARWGMNYVPESGPGPVELAREAHVRGDRLLRVDVPISWVQGATAIDQAATRLQRVPADDVLGQIEDVGWRLEHASSVFVANGVTSTGVTTSSYRTDKSATHGVVLGVYVFRRAS